MPHLLGIFYVIWQLSWPIQNILTNHTCGHFTPFCVLTLFDYFSRNPWKFFMVLHAWSENAKSFWNLQSKTPPSLHKICNICNIQAPYSSERTWFLSGILFCLFLSLPLFPDGVWNITAMCIMGLHYQWLSNACCNCREWIYLDFSELNNREAFNEPSGWRKTVHSCYKEKG